ncbi:anti-sigma factor family protein [Paenibacillus sp. FSL W7-1287]|uniref:anti-sigma factor family protein n=1 Tax=Paenibacillus sp. FSL W7-1287 TaxID=2954538 RepID=UPI0030FB5B2E
MNCKQVDELLHTYWQLDEENPLRIEIEAHLFDCEHCAANLDLEPIAFPVLDEKESLLGNSALHSSANISENVMKRIYEEEAWYMPITSKRYQFTKSFRRNAAIAIASCLAMFSIALFLFIFDYYKNTTAMPTAKVSGIVDVANASANEGVYTSIYTGSIPVASISDPIVLQVVPTFPQYYVALSFVGIVMTLLVMGWFTRTRQ